MTPALSKELAYVGLLFGLFVVPRILQRWRIPAAVTSLVLGALAGPGFGLFAHDSTIGLLSTLGIVSLFLFAGLDVEVADLRREALVLGEHLVVRVLALAGGGWLAYRTLDLDVRSAVLVALALLTPSTGFILDSLPALGLEARTAFWVRTKAIATELVALGALFFTLQSASVGHLAVSSGALLAMIVVLPLVFRGFARFIVPHAPRTEFAFLLMTAVVCAFATRQLGVYYLVGAFIVGVVAQRVRERLPAMASERMLHAVEAFSSIFVPFYFFHAGLELRREDFSLHALLVGLAFLAVAVPLRLGLISAHRRLRLGEGLRSSLRVGIPLLPTLVFTLVVAQILRDRFGASPAVFGGLVIYALGSTVLPSILMRTPAQDFDAPRLPPLEGAAFVVAPHEGPGGGPGGGPGDGD